ncbi:MAG: hypothetical protein KGJ68_10295 [Gammaproteobacteria bacterium]|nr:hypothetical protein [Gammaproteobacteria bacterium]
MPFEIKETRELAAIEVRLWGSVDGADIRALAAAVIGLGKTSGLRRVLVDCREYLGGAGFREVLSLTKDVMERPAEERGREAFIAPRDPYAAADVTFYIHTANSLGSTARMFTSGEEAVGWLTRPG